METLLRNFYKDEHTREAVLAYLISQLEKTAIKRVMKKEDTTGIADAHKIINEAFITLKEQYEEVQKSIPPSSR